MRKGEKNCLNNFAKVRYTLNYIKNYYFYNFLFYL